ncbi:restriction endonuclease subunit S [Saccharopolyspora spinosa]|uniref:restriction endonuclease subunit S n=1 Tax=Saccharopolyspora spinosa TaxID=60894 RepID=UPI000A02CA3A|nr:restriction endonuclease subunit S [Saccharopolyspora spinosa]
MDLGKIKLNPSTWTASSLGEHVGMISGVHIDSELANNEGRGVPYLTGPADFKGDVAVATRYTEWPQVMCQAGDILVTVKGSGAGRVAIAVEDACISRQLAAICTPVDERNYWLSIINAHYEELQSRASSGLIPGLSRGDLLSLRVLLPTAGERRAISKILDSFDKAIRSIEAERSKLFQFKAGLVDDLLTGRVLPA